uniref:Reverse transcriptase domain-containing protein n=1 Tax=Cajanus cajan TaxID=3821 RepID=A0A151UGR4_CAJCA
MVNDGLKVESRDPLEEVNLGSIEKRRITYVSKLAEKSVKEQIVQVLHKYKDCFAWDYEEMPGLDRNLVKYRLPMILGKKPVKQNPRRFAPQAIEKIKEEIERLLKDKFIRTSRYADWVSNIVPVVMIEKGGRISKATKGQVIVDFLVDHSNLEKCHSLERKNSQLRKTESKLESGATFYTNKYKNREGPRPKCDHCRKIGHEKARYYELIGYPAKLG